MRPSLGNAYEVMVCTPTSCQVTLKKKDPACPPSLNYAAGAILNLQMGQVVVVTRKIKNTISRVCDNGSRSLFSKHGVQIEKPALLVMAGGFFLGRN